MNKYFVWACLAGVFMWSVTSCSEQTMMDQGIHASGEAQREVQITFHLSVISGMQTRGGRPLYSSEALQMVNDMKVYVFKKDANTETFVYDGKSYSIEAFDNTDTPYDGEGYETHYHTLDTKLTDGTYKFLAVGLEKGHEETFSFAPTTTTTLDAAVLSLKSTDIHADEAFSGVSEEVTVSEDRKGFFARIELKRVVAGVLGYFKNIPYQVENNGKKVVVKKVCVELLKKATQVRLEDRGASTDGLLQPTSYYRLLTIDLSGASFDSDNNIYISDAVGTEGTPVKVENSFLAGGYALPFDVGDGQKTMKLVLYGGEPETALRTYKVQDEIKTAAPVALTECFSIEADHFYSLGLKSKDNDTEEDKPIDLSKDQTIKITVDASWEDIYHITGK